MAAVDEGGKKNVYVVVKQADAGYVVLVASTSAKAARYIEDNPYSSFIMLERTVDVPQT